MVIKRIAVGPLATNCYVVSCDGDAFIIDPGDDVQTIRDYIKKNNLNVQFIINTHSHIDHIKADRALGYPVYIHRADAPALKDVSKNHSRLILGSFEPCKPAKVLEDGDEIEFCGKKIKVLHTPGHTVGGICLALDKVVFTGDTLFRDGVGRTDLPDGSERDILNAIRKKLLCLDDDVTIYPGHGEASTIGRERGNF